MGLQLYNSLTRRKEEFKPLHEGHVAIYVCGPTVYGHAHLGHAKSYVSFDVLVRYLRYLGYKVTYVQNITDVGHLTDDADAGEDKIAKAARLEKKHPMALAEYYTRSYFEDMDRLNCVRPDISPRASGHIVEQIELVKKLIERGYAYEVNGSVYFDVSKFENYGRLSGRNVDEMIAGARVEVSPEKRNPVDFALWKRAEPNHIMQWPSLWGMGYPGWHLECSVMSTKYLGQPFDIHGGGLENQFPHHECEIAQSEAANDVQFARWWVHNNMVTVDGQKMGKSLNNFITLKQAFAGSHERLTRAYGPLAIRQLILNSHYRSPLDFSDAALFATQSGCEKIAQCVKSLRKKLTEVPDGRPDSKVAEQLGQLKVKFQSAMDDDLNTAVALSVVFELVRLANDLSEDKTTNTGTLRALDEMFTNLGGDVLGIIVPAISVAAPGKSFVVNIHDGIGVGEYVKGEIVPKQKQATLNDLIRVMIENRTTARKQRDFTKADWVRSLLDEVGIVLEDRTDGTTAWRWK
jgi:cysteinyl-tRNA synthetase